MYEIDDAPNEEIDDSIIQKMLRSKSPKEEFEDYITSNYDTQEYTEEILNDFLNFLLYDKKIKKSVANDMIDSNMDKLMDMFYVSIPYDDFLNQNVVCRLTLKGGREGGIFLLGELLGYDEKNMESSLKRSSNKISDKTLKSIVDEYNETKDSDWYESVVFIGNMKIKDLFEQKQNGNSVEVTSGCVCGLFDKDNGAGSLLDIQINKNIIVDSSDIKNLCVDSAVGYSVYETYGIYDVDGNFYNK